MRLSSSESLIPFKRFEMQALLDILENVSKSHVYCTHKQTIGGVTKSQANKEGHWCVRQDLATKKSPHPPRICNIINNFSNNRILYNFDLQKTMASWNLFVIIIFVVIWYIVSCAYDVFGFRMIFFHSPHFF